VEAWPLRPQFDGLALPARVDATQVLPPAVVDTRPHEQGAAVHPRRAVGRAQQALGAELERMQRRRQLPVGVGFERERPQPVQALGLRAGTATVGLQVIAKEARTAMPRA